MPNLPPQFDWRQSRQHLSILGRFRNPNPGKFLDWRYLINESGESAIERFLKDGALVLCNLTEKVAYKLTVPELKEAVRRHGHKPPSGKAELAAAAVLVAASEMEEVTAGAPLYKCTTVGLDAITGFERRRAEAESSAQADSYQHLLESNAKAAYTSYAKYVRVYVSPDYVAQPYEVKGINFILKSAPEAIGYLEPAAWQQLRAAAAMTALWRTRVHTVWLPDSFSTTIDDNARAVRILLRQAKFREEVFQQAQWCKKVRLRFDDADIDVCEHCLVLNGTEHQIDAIPEVPSAHCTSRNGCVCRLENAAVAVDQDEEDRELSLVLTELERDAEGELTRDQGDADPLQRLRQLRQMLNEQLIGLTEYEAKKKEILSRM